MQDISSVGLKKSDIIKNREILFENKGKFQIRSNTMNLIGDI